MSEATVSSRSDVVQVWQDVLNRPVTEESMFFEVGGSSIAAMKVCARVGARVDVAVPILLLLENSRCADFVAAVDALLAQVEAQPGGQPQ